MDATTGSASGDPPAQSAATFACHLIDKGVDIYTVSRLLGHSSVKVTEKHYLALDPMHVLEAVGKLGFGTSEYAKGDARTMAQQDPAAEK